MDVHRENSKGARTVKVALIAFLLGALTVCIVAWWYSWHKFEPYPAYVRLAIIFDHALPYIVLISFLGFTTWVLFRLRAHLIIRKAKEDAEKVLLFANEKAAQILEDAQSDANQLVKEAKKYAEERKAEIDSKKSTWIANIDALERKLKKREEQMGKLKAILKSKPKGKYNPVGYARTLVEDWDVPMKRRKDVK